MFSSSLIIFAQQHAIIKGNVKISNGKAAPQISIMLKGKSMGSKTDEKGDFVIKHVKAGNYIIKASAGAVAILKLREMCLTY